MVLNGSLCACAAERHALPIRHVDAKLVRIRLSDFKTNEYAQLLGGSAFEPKEANPMLGFRGASRYADPAYAEGFALECAALRWG
jgi:phosphoenolpyruvate synthase/pyruvate phosphate dikinase